jgi:hypothetical protein
MKTYQVTFSAIVDLDVEAEDADEAVAKARKQLDPDVDWDVESIEEVLS